MSQNCPLERFETIERLYRYQSPLLLATCFLLNPRVVGNRTHYRATLSPNQRSFVLIHIEMQFSHPAEFAKPGPGMTSLARVTKPRNQGSIQGMSNLSNFYHLCWHCGETSVWVCLKIWRPFHHDSSCSIRCLMIMFA